MKEVNLGTEIARLEQIVSEDTYSKRNIHKMVREDILGDMKGIAKVYKRCCKAVRKYMDGKYYMSKQARLEHIRYVEPEEIVLELFSHVMVNPDPVSIQKIVGAFYPWFEYEDFYDGVKTAAEILGACRKAKLYKIIEGRESEDGYINILSKWSLDDKTMDYIDRARFLDPMTVVPDVWSTNSNGGYITTKSSVILGSGKHHDEEQALDVLNILQGIRWTLDEHLANEPEVSKEPLDTLEKKENFALLKRVSKQVRKEMLDMGNMFYLPWQLDFRGRMYSQGHYINFQGNSFRKAQLNYAEKRLIEG